MKIMEFSHFVYVIFTQGVGSDSNSDGGGEYSSDGGGGGDGDGLMVVNICLQTPPAPPWFCSLHPCCVTHLILQVSFFNRVPVLRCSHIVSKNISSIRTFF